MGRVVIVQPGQTLEDIALQEYGSVDGVEWLLLDNEELLPDGFSTEVSAGIELSLRDEYTDRDTYAAARRLAVIPASGPLIGEALPAGGDHNNDFNNDFL